MLIVADKNIPLIESMYESLADIRLIDGYSISYRDVREADILLVRSVTRIDRNILEGSNVRYIGTVTSGYDHVDLEYLSSKGIKSAFASGCNSNSVAEYIVAAILVLCRRFGLDPGKMTLGVIGIGNIGSKVVNKATALGMNVLQNDPPLHRKTRDSRFLPIDDLIGADIITLHVPLTYRGEDATYHLFDKKRIAAMKPGSILINTSRGRVVNSGSLRNALNSGHLRTAVLDVWENEPEIDNCLLSMCAIGTPHIAGYSVEGKTNGAWIIYQAVCEHLNVSPAWNPAGKLPLPIVSGIRIDKTDPDHSELLGGIVRKCYDIEKDDSKLREVLQMNPENSKNYFHKLRADYPVRREFKATSIEVPKSRDALARCLEGIGFTVVKI